ncbi:MAG: helix-turn-helix domain-containing protein [Desulfamplus sp.]|nr:helix-turn-helix domain-containing protein [Desulfamplus sp.]
MAQMLEDKPNVLTIGEVAEILNVSTMTLRRWDAEGILKAFRPSKTKQRRYHKKDVLRFLQSTPENGMEPKSL